MNLLDFLTHPTLNKYVKKIKGNRYLFQQGQIAKTMFFIIEGRIELLGEKDGAEYVASTLEAGQFMGEKAIAQTAPYQRVFSARADTDAIVLELGPKDISEIEKMDPSIITSLLRGMLNGIAKRFDLANYLVRVLRSSNNIERLCHVILYFCRCSGKRYPGGVEVTLTVDSIHNYIDMDKTRIKTALKDLEAQKLIIEQRKNHFLVPNEQALLEYIPNLVQRLAA